MKILIFFLLFFASCQPKIYKQVDKLHGLIFEYTGEENKPIPTLIFFDSSNRNFKTNYYDKYVLENEMLNNLSNCIPKYSDTITSHYPLYKITSIYDSSQNIIYIISAQNLNSFFDCAEEYITRNNFYNAYIEFENARAINPPK